MSGDKSLIDVYHVKIKFNEYVLGGVPRNYTEIERFLKARNHPPEDIPRLKEQIAKEVEPIPQSEAKSEEPDSSWTGFKRDNNGLFFEERHIKGLLKEAARVLGLKIKSTINYAVSVEPPRLYFRRDDGTIIKEPSGTLYDVGHVTGPKGSRSIRKCSDFIEKPVLEFDLVVIRGSKIKKDDLEKLLKVGEKIGLGKDRTLGYGKYRLIHFQEVRADK